MFVLRLIYIRFISMHTVDDDLAEIQPELSSGVQSPLLLSEDENKDASKVVKKSFHPHQAAEIQLNRIKVGGALLAGQDVSDLAEKPEYADLVAAFSRETPPFIFRYVPLGHVFGVFGEALTYGKIPEGDKPDKQSVLTVQNGEGLGFAKESRALPAGCEYSAFISYRWLTRRWKLWLGLCYEYNFTAALVVPTIGCIISFFLMSLITNPCSWKFPPVFFKCLEDGPQAGRSIWFFNYWFWPTVSLIILFYGSSIALFYRKVFVDRWSVHQKDPTYNGLALQHLSDFLARSKSIVILFDENYFDRLWCLFELATYAKVRKKPNIRFVNVYSGILIGIWLFRWFVQMLIVADLAGRDDKTKRCMFMFCGGELAKSDFGQELLDLLFYIRFIFEFAFMYAYVRTHSISQDKFFDHLQRFDARRAKCGAPHDREMLLAAIENRWGDGNVTSATFEQVADASPDSSENDDLVPASPGVRAFNKFTRGVLREQMSMRSIRRYQVFPYVFTIGFFDVLTYSETSGLDFYPLWDRRNVTHDPTRAEGKTFWVLFYWSVVLVPIGYYIVGVIMFFVVRLSRKYPLKINLLGDRFGDIPGIIFWGLLGTSFCAALIVGLGCAVWLLNTFLVNTLCEVGLDCFVLVSPYFLDLNYTVRFTAFTWQLTIVLFWVFLAINCCACWILYEPRWSERMRARMFRSCPQWIRWIGY